MNIETVKSQLKTLKLPTALRELENVVKSHRQAVSLHWISELLEREIDERKERAMARRIESAHFPEVKTLEGFDWKFNPKINKEKVEELSGLEFIKTNQIALFLGNAGTGKTHIALAIGVLAAKAGHRVYCTSAKRLAQELTVARLKNNLDLLFKKILSADLWIIDDWGVVSMSREIIEEVFDLFDRRKYHSAMILTSNRDIKEWNEVFPDPVLANATIDRIFDRAQVVIFEGKSYRLNGRISIPEFNIPKSKTQKKEEIENN